jgi:hypothetical protein
MTEFVNVNHPECKNDEVLLGNFLRKDFGRIRYDWKRVGFQAYDENDKKYPPESNLYPVFVKRTEYVKYGGTLLKKKKK